MQVFTNTSDDIKWGIVERAFKLSYHMLESEPGKNFTAEHRFDLFQTIFGAMMMDACRGIDPVEESNLQRQEIPMGNLVELEVKIGQNTYLLSESEGRLLVRAKGQIVTKPNSNQSLIISTE